MAGSMKRIYPNMKLWSLSLLLLVLVVGIPPTQVLSQSSDDIRAELGAYFDDGRVIIQVSLPRGQTLEEATLTLEGGEVISLDPNPAPLPVTQWFILDGSEEMLNVYTRVGTSVERFVQGNEDFKAGLIFFDSEVNYYEPTAQQGDFETLLEAYTATAGEIGCTGDALAQLADYPRQPDEALRVLLVVSSRTRQGSCTEQDLVSAVNVPIDVIVIDNEIDDDYQDLADRTGGQLHQANISTITTRFNEVKTLWSQPVYALNGTFTSTPSERGTLNITLTSEQTYDIPVRLMNLTVAEVAAAPTPAEAGPSIVFPDTPTPEPPTATPQAEISPTVATPAEATEAAPSVATEVSIAPTLPVNVTEVAQQATENVEAALELATTEGNNTVATVEAANELATTAAENATQAVLTLTPIAAPATTTEEEELNPMLFVGVGLLVLAVVIIVGYTLLGRGTPTPHPVLKGAGEITQYMDTYIEQPQNEAFHLYSKGEAYTPARPDAVNAPPRNYYEDFINQTAPTFDRTLIDESPAQLTTEDELMITQMLADEDFKLILKESAPDIIGWLRLVTAETPKDFPITSTGGIIGRKQNLPFSIAGDGLVSHEHARLDIQADQSVWLTVISHTNPVLVSGVLLERNKTRRLLPQDVIQLSPKTRLIFVQRDDDNSYDDGVTRI